MLKQNTWITTSVCQVIDLIILILLGYGVFYFHIGALNHIPKYYYFVILSFSILALMIQFLCGVYNPIRTHNIFRLIKRLIISWLFLLGFFSLYFFLTKTGAYYSRFWLLIWLGLSFLCTIIYRIALAFFLSHMRRQGFNLKYIVLIGSGNLVNKIVALSKSSQLAGYRVVTIFALEKNSGDIEGIPIVALPEHFDEYFINNPVDEIWICLPLNQEANIKDLMHRLQYVVIDIRFVPNMFELNLLNHSISEVSGIPIIDLRCTPMKGINRLVKWLEDKLLALLILILISPLFLFIAALVKCSSKGPVFYKQKRMSWNGKIFNILKFRSMPVDIESRTGAVWAKEGEVRATKMGAFLRKTSLDELPQFINVLKGDMSIVGPRPERPELVKNFKDKIPGYMQKHIVKAGITGWAQINGWRGNTDLEKRIEYDLFYIEHWSLSLDIKIIFLTIFKGFINKNAY